MSSPFLSFCVVVKAEAALGNYFCSIAVNLIARFEFSGFLMVFVST
jgi:hypothetical protein